MPRPSSLRSLVVAIIAFLSLAPANAQSPAAAPPPNSPVSLVVFSDFQCPYSSDLFFTLENLQKKYPNRLHIAWKQSPLDIHPEAPLAHRAALAAANQGYFDAMAELLYANQAHQDRASLLSFAAQLHLDMPRFRRDLDSAATTAKLEADHEEMQAFAIQQTPTLYIDGKTLVGVQSEQALAAIIDKAQAKPAAILPQDADAPLDPTLAAQILTTPIASQGQADAPLTIVEFTDFQCPFCREAVAPMEQFLAARGRQVRWIFRAFPLGFHPDAELAAEAALAAGDQGKFWQMHDLLFTNQSALKLPDLRRYAQQLQLDMKAFDHALETHQFAGQIAADRALGTRAGVSGTPTFFVDGHAMVGVQQIPELNQLAEAHLAGAGSPPRVAAVVVPDPIVPDQQVLGPPAGTPTSVMTWYVDVRSPLAARQAELLRSLEKQYQDQIRVFFRAFAVDAHPDSRLSGAALLAALRQDKFWPMYDALAQRRDILDREKLLSLAQTLGLNPATFASALDAAGSEVAQDIHEAERRGIRGAPVLFINRQRVDGLQAEKFYTGILDAEQKTIASAQPVGGLSSN